MVKGLFYLRYWDKWCQFWSIRKLPNVHFLCKRSIRPRPHVSGDFCIRKFFHADTKYLRPHVAYTNRIRPSTRIRFVSGHLKGLVNRACALRLVLILWRQRIQKYTDTSVHTYPDTQRIQKFPLWRAYTEIFGYTERIRRTRVDARCIRIKKFADTKISGYVWTGPNKQFFSGSNNLCISFCQYSLRNLRGFII